MKNFQSPGPLRILYFSIGCVMVVLGIIGAALPIMPTVPFLIVASWCFARSSPRFHHWVHNHKVFGPPIKRWEENQAIAPWIKAWAVISMACGFAITVFFTQPALWLVALVGAIMLAVAIYILTRPS